MSITSNAKKFLGSLPSSAQSYIKSQNYGDKLSSGEAKKFYDQWNAQETARQKKESDLMSRAPESLKNDPTFKSLPADLKEITIYNYEVQKANNAQKAEALQKSLEVAAQQADPYWANIIRIAQTEVSNGIAELTGDHNSQVENLGRQVQYINEDLARNKTNLSLDQQQQLASLAADLTDRKETFQRNIQYLGGEKASQLYSMELNYSKNIDDINRNLEYTTAEKDAALEKLSRDFVQNRSAVIGNAADAGLTFSTKRKIVENRLAEDNNYMVESTLRQYNQAVLQGEAERQYSTSQFIQGKSDIERKATMQTEEEKAAMATSERQIQEARDTIQRKYSQQIADLETEAARGNVTAQAQLADLKRKLQESIKSTGITAEKYLGTENLPSIAGYEALGNVPGTLYEEKVKDIEQRKQSLYNDMTAASLPF
jgi:hypothetical protein